MDNDAARDALAKAARELSKASDDDLAPFVRAWEAGRLDAAFDSLRAIGERFAETPNFWYALAHAAERLGRDAEGVRIIDAHGV